MTSAARKALIMIATAALLCGGWLMFAPRAVGGPITLVMTHGISMSPRFHTGDLGVLHERSSYGIGDIVGYHSHVLKNVTVMHRIVDRRADGTWVTKGDHNTWLDPDHPTNADIVGKLWFRVPHGGLFLTKLVLPLIALALLSMIILPGPRRRMARHLPSGWRVPRWKVPPSWRVSRWKWAAAQRPPRTQEAQAKPGTAIPRPAVRGPGRPRPPAGRPHSGARSLLNTVSPGLVAALPVVVVVAISAAVLGALVSLLGFAQPAHRTSMGQRTWTTNTQFGWSAQVPVSSVYPTGSARSPQPVFTRIVDKITMQAAVQAAGLHVPAGSAITLDANLADGTGWSRDWTLSRASLGVDGSGSLAATVSLHQLLVEMAKVHLTSGVSAPVTFTLAVRSPAAGQDPLGTLAFALDAGSLRPQGDLRATTSGKTLAPITRAASAQVAGKSVPVAALRILGPLLLLLGALVAGVAMVAKKKAGPETESERLLRHFSGRVVRLGPGATDGVEYHDVADAKALCVLAKSETSMLFISAAPTTYFVDHNGQLFRYAPRRRTGVPRQRVVGEARSTAVPAPPTSTGSVPPAALAPRVPAQQSRSEEATSSQQVPRSTDGPPAP